VCAASIEIRRTNRALLETAEALFAQSRIELARLAAWSPTDVGAIRPPRDFAPLPASPELWQLACCRVVWGVAFAPHTPNRRKHSMKRTILAGMLALVVALSAGAGAAGNAHDLQGKVKSIEVNQRVLTLEDATELYWTDTVTVTESVLSGALVKATYEERGGRFMLTRLEVLQ
jgi:hypothetical protein